MPYCVEGTVLSSSHSLFCLIFPKAFLFTPLDLLSTLPTCPVPPKAARWCTAGLATWLPASASVWPVGRTARKSVGTDIYFPGSLSGHLKLSASSPGAYRSSRHPFQQLPTLGSTECLFLSFASSARGSNSSPLCLALPCWVP